MSENIEPAAELHGRDSKFFFFKIMHPDVADWGHARGWPHRQSCSVVMASADADYDDAVVLVRYCPAQ